MTPCCTHAIHLLLLTLGIKEGDEIIVPECTWTGSVAPITYQKAIPVFADIDDNWCLSVETIKKKITKKTKAILVVDLYGNMPDMDDIQELADDNNILLIEDSAEALGSKYYNVRAGKFGVGSVHSFHRTKTLTTGEGGLLLLDDEELYSRAKFLRDHGRSSVNPYYVLEPAPKYMPSNLQAALALAQFDRIDELVNRKRDILYSYKKNLAKFDFLSLNMDNDNIFNGAWATTMVMGKRTKILASELMKKLEIDGIPSRPFFYPMSSVPAYEKYLKNGKDINPNSYNISKRGITLPSHYLITDSQLNYIADKIIKNLKD